MIVAHSGEVWSKRPDEAYPTSCLENIFVTVPSQSTPDGNLSSLADEKTPVPFVVSDATSYIQKDMPLPASGVPTHHVSPSTPTCRVQEDAPLTAIDPPPHSSDPLAPSFDPIERETEKTETELTSDEIPDHINLLYETTVAQTRLTSEVDKQFRDVLRRRATSFATDSTDLGFCPLLKHDVDTGDSPPIKQSPRRPPLSVGNAENDIIDDMLATGVIEPSTSEWASPVCLVKKPDGSYRFCIDYRRVNAVSCKDAFPIPDIQDALDSLRGARWLPPLVSLAAIGSWE